MKGKCKNCGEEFHYKEILKTYMIGSGNILCKKCNTKNEVELITKLLISALIIIPILISIFKNELNLSYPRLPLISLIYILIVIAVSPFFIKYE